MIGVVVVTHGQLATELVNAAETIVGDLPQFAAVSIGWHDDVDDAREGDQAGDRTPAGARRRADPHRHVRRHAGQPRHDVPRERQLEVITGVNLPMLIKLASVQKTASNLLAVAREMREHGRNAIWVASDLLRAEGKPESA